MLRRILRSVCQSYWQAQFGSRRASNPNVYAHAACHGFGVAETLDERSALAWVIGGGNNLELLEFQLLVLAQIFTGVGIAVNGSVYVIVGNRVSHETPVTFGIFRARLKTLKELSP